MEEPLKHVSGVGCGWDYCNEDRRLHEKWQQLMQSMSKESSIPAENGRMEVCKLVLVDHFIMQRMGSFPTDSHDRWQRLCKFFSLAQSKDTAFVIGDTLELNARREVAIFSGGDGYLPSTLARGLLLHCTRKELPSQLPWSSFTMQLIRDVQACVFLDLIYKHDHELCFHPMMLPYDDASMVRLAFQSGFIPGETCWSPYVEADFMLELLTHGFITIANRVKYKDTFRTFLVPKMHIERCCMYPINIRLKSKVKKLASKWRVTVNVAFEQVIAGIVKQHGENWMYPEVQRELCRIHYNRNMLNSRHAGGKINSVEVWQGNDLIAGEIGFSIGGVYTSLSGFHTVSNSGSFQVSALAAILYFQGFKLWDLGMYLPYKIDMGGFTFTRTAFINAFEEAKSHSCKLEVPADFCLEPNCRKLYESLVIKQGEKST